MSGEFLPPDPYADAAAEARPPDRTAIIAIAVGAAGLTLALIGSWALAVAIPASLAACVLGVRARHRGRQRDHADVAVLIGAIGTLLGFVAAAATLLA